MGKLTRSDGDSETVKYFNNKELEALFRVIAKNKRDSCLFRFGYHFGLRASEVGLIRLSDLVRDDDGNSAVRITRVKGSKGGIFPLVPVVARALRAWLPLRGDSPGALFPSRKGSPISQQRLDVMMKQYGAAAGLARDKCHWHALRHSCATSLLERGEDIMYIKEHLGHRDVKNTLIYATVTHKLKREVHRRLKDWK
jgi:integrase